jgi:hypothetical protein
MIRSSIAVLGFSVSGLRDNELDSLVLSAPTTDMKITLLDWCNEVLFAH